MIFYVNHPVLRWRDQLFVRTLNFVDFADAVVARLPGAQLVLPARQVEAEPGLEFTPLQLAQPPLLVPGYSGHWQALARTLGNVRRIARQARRYEPPLVLGHAPGSMLTALSYVLPRRSRFVLFVRGDTPQTVLHMYQDSRYGRWPHRLSRTFERRAFTLQRQQRALVFTYGDHLARRYAAHAPDAATVRSIAPLITATMITPQPVPLPPAPKLRALFVGRLSQEKGVLELVRALSLAPARQVHLTIAGEGPLAGAIADQIRQLDLTGRVHLAGFVTPAAVAGLLDAHHLLVLPSRTEGVPRVIAEACARGRTTLATDVGGIRCAFGDAVRLLPSGSSADIAAGLGECADNIDRLPADGARAHRLASRFTLSHHADSVAQEVAQWR